MRRNLLTHALIVAMEMDQLHAERANERRQAEERDAPICGISEMPQDACECVVCDLGVG